MKGTKATKLLCLGMAALLAFPTVPQMTVQAEKVAVQTEEIGVQMEEAVVQSTTTEDFYYSVLTDGTLEITRYKGSDTEITIPAEIDGKKVTSIGRSAFSQCYGLTSIEIPKGVTSIGGGAFQGCSSLTNIKIPEGVTSIGVCAFFRCNSLTNIKIPEGVTSIGMQAFAYCTNLTSIILPDSLTTIAELAFQGCSSLTNITIPEGVTYIDNSALKGCSELMEINVNENNVKYSSIDGVLFNASVTEIICCGEKRSGAYRIPKGVTSIGYNAFQRCSGLTSITIPEEVKSIGYNVFQGCTNLEIVCVKDSYAHTYAEENDIPYRFIEEESDNDDSQSGFTYVVLEDSTLEITGYKGSDTEITIPAEIDGKKVASIGIRAFSGCTSLTSIIIPEGVKSIGLEAFESCSSLNSITIPEGVKSIRLGAFESCSSLKSITIPEGVTSIERYTFLDCTSLTSITIPEGVKSIGLGAFASCSSLKSITIPEGVTSVEEDTFSECTSLTSITIPEGVTSIGVRAFAGCSGLTSITIPEGVTSIGDAAFRGCNNLVIVCVENSYAHTYAVENDIPYRFIDEEETDNDESTKEYTITFEVNGGTALTQNSKVVEEGNAIGDLPVAERAGYTFKGWFTQKTGGTEVTATTTVIKDMTIYAQWEVVKQSMEKAVITLSENSFVYDGKAKTPEVKSVTVNGKTLTKDDYTVSYKNNTDVGTASVIITGKGTYTGTATKNFTIKEASVAKISLSGADVKLSASSCTYTGKAQKPTIKYVKVNGKTLTKDDYTVSYKNNTDVGTAKVIIKGTGRYTGKVTKEFKIKAASVNGADVKLSATSCSYTDKAQKPTVKYVKVNGKKLTAGSDYTITYKNNINIGTAKVVIQGIGNYTGKVTKEFKIKAEKGTTFTVGAYKYQITGTSQVAFAGLKSTKAKVTIKETVKIGGKTFKVTSVADKALYKNTKVTSVTIGSNVKTIGKGAFRGCSKLKNITIQSTKLEAVGSNALKGIKSTATIKVPAKKFSVYKTLLQNKGQGKNVKIVK